MKYSNERKQAILATLCPSHNRSIREAAAKEGVSETTLYDWHKPARGLQRNAPGVSHLRMGAST